jgi:hypothetical protein
MALLALLARIPRSISRTMTALAAIIAALVVVALVDPQWIETTLRLSPDGGSGGTEWDLVLVFAVAALALGVLTLATAWARSRRVMCADPARPQGLTSGGRDGSHP